MPAKVRRVTAPWALAGEKPIVTEILSSLPSRSNHLTVANCQLLTGGHLPRSSENHFVARAVEYPGVRKAGVGHAGHRWKQRPNFPKLIIVNGIFSVGDPGASQLHSVRSKESNCTKSFLLGGGHPHLEKWLDNVLLKKSNVHQEPTRWS